MWGISGSVGAEAAAALAKQQEDQRRERELKAQLEAQAMELVMRQAEAVERQRHNAALEKERARGTQLADAEATVSVLDSAFDPSSGVPAEVSEGVTRTLRGTPYEARLQTRSTLPATPTSSQAAAFRGPDSFESLLANGLRDSAESARARFEPLGLGRTMDPTPRNYSTLAPTGQQQGAQRQLRQGLAERSELERQIADVKTPPKLRTILNLRRAGVETSPVGATLLETDADRTAAEDRADATFRRRADYQDNLIRGRQTTDTPERVTAKDRLAATRQARQDAIAEYNATKDLAGSPTQDLNALIDEREAEYLEALDAIAAQEDGPDVADDGPTPGRTLGPLSPAPNGAPRMMPSHGAPGILPNGRRLAVGLSRRTPAGGNSSPSGPAQPRATDFNFTATPRKGQRGIVNGQLAEWDGKGWLPVAP